MSLGHMAIDVSLSDGRHVVVRAISAADAEGLMTMHRQLSKETNRRRFLAYVPELAPHQAVELSDLDGHDRVALVAEDDSHHLAAVVRYSRLPGTADADLAAVVQDDFQQQGLGSLLLALLARQARAEGIECFVADVLTDNTPMFRTLRDAGLSGPAEYDAGVAHLVLRLPAVQVGTNDPGRAHPSG
jgi:GNAT superfamily N-acetyltransferase